MDEEKPKILFSGFPGNMETIAARHIINSGEFDMIRLALTGLPDAPDEYEVEGMHFSLAKPEHHDRTLGNLAKTHGANNIIVIDFASDVQTIDGRKVNVAALPNAQLYCRYGLNFIMGSTGGPLDAIKDEVRKSGNRALISPNMSPQIAALPSELERYATENAGTCKGVDYCAIESHQPTKPDKSGTAINIGKIFARLGVNYRGEEDITKIRDVDLQRQLGVPESALRGHGWHTYLFTSQQESEGIAGIRDFFANFLDHPVFSGYRLSFEPVLGISPSFNFINNYARQKLGKDLSSLDYEIHRVSPDNTVCFFFYAGNDNKSAVLGHNVNGRETYGAGNLHALRYFAKNRHSMQAGETRGMSHVLEALVKSK